MIKEITAEEFLSSNGEGLSWVDMNNEFVWYEVVKKMEEYAFLKKPKWISVEDRLPDCWSQHRYDYGSGYLLGYTKYNEIEITQFWKIKEDDGTYKNYWEGDDEKEFNYITYWMPLPEYPQTK